MIVDLPLGGIVIVDLPLGGIVIVDLPLGGIVIVDLPLGGICSILDRVLLVLPVIYIFTKIRVLKQFSFFFQPLHEEFLRHRLPWELLVYVLNYPCHFHCHRDHLPNY